MCLGIATALRLLANLVPTEVVAFVIASAMTFAIGGAVWHSAFRLPEKALPAVRE